MTIYHVAMLALGSGLFYMAALPGSSQGAGFSGVGSAPCGAGAQHITGSFSSKKAQYFTTDTCTTTGSVGTPITFPYKAEGRFSDNVAVETIEVAPAPPRQPLHPFGRWTKTYMCQTDPWLAPDPFPTGAIEPVVKCQLISRKDFSPAWGPLQDGKLDKPLDSLFNVWGKDKPVTSYYLSPPQRQALAVKRESDLRAEADALAKAEAARRQEAQHLQGATQAPSQYRTSLSPVILSPASGQRFLTGTVVPIRLGPPPQWADASVALDGTPIRTTRSATFYLIRLERKDPNGNWVSYGVHTVSAADAQSARGYTGFGAGVPVATPGAWRLNAQVSLPQQSGWSNWVEFVVMPLQPDSMKSLAPKMTQPPTRSFGK